MRDLNYDLGITAKQVASHLRQFPVLSIVGYIGSGKSTLAEILGKDLHDYDFDVFMQNATTWLHAPFGSDSGETQTQARVDPEIVSAVKRLEDSDGKGCWIIDDAEVLLAYTTEELLRYLGERLNERDFFLVLLRNRFILEEAGWLRNRQSLISPDIQSLAMQPLQEEYAVEIATTLFDGDSRLEQGKWLASMSGGIPGLMSDLYPYTPAWPDTDPTTRLIGLIDAKKRTLDLKKPLRSLLLTALDSKVLPPAILLSPQAKNELGTLILNGMVSPHYATKDSPFQGDFWKLVYERHTTARPIPIRLQDIGLNIEIMLREAEVADLLCQDFGIAPNAEGVLAQSFAACLYCEENFPSLVQPLHTFMSESLGRLGLIRLLRSQGVRVDVMAPTTELAAELFEMASSR